MTPTTRSRRRCFGPGGRIRASAVEARCAPGSTGSRPTSALTRLRAVPSGCCRSTTVRHPGRSWARAPGACPRGCGSSPTRTRRSASPTAPRGPRRATNDARRCSWRSSRRCSTCRAALILRDVLGFSAREAAETLATTEPSVNGALRRARATIDQRLPDPSQQVMLRALGDRRLEAIVERFADSFERGDVGAILELLTEDVTFSMPPYLEWCRGRDAVAGSWLMPSGPPCSLHYVPARASGQL